VTGYDVIGDVHGHAGVLRVLLAKLGYVERAGAYRHHERQAVFVGDLIDRGREQLTTLNLVRSMVDAGSALAVLGNHEFNAVAWATPDEHGEPCREHSAKNQDQHEDFLGEVVEGSDVHRNWIDWFKTIPLWLDLGGLRVVHACWHEPSMRVLEPHLTRDRCLTETVVRARRGTPLYDAVEVLLKGPEIDLGPGRSYVDKDGFDRARARYRWWDPVATTLRQAAEIPGDAQDSAGSPFAPLPDEPLDEQSLLRYTETVPVVLGHYWRTGTPAVLTPKVACVDYSAGKGGDLVAYRWSGESVLRDDHFVAAPGRG
jgi:hypothetical protein